MCKCEECIGDGGARSDQQYELPPCSADLATVSKYMMYSYFTWCVGCRCQLFLASVEEKARGWGLRVRPLPLLKPLPFPSDAKTLFVELRQLVYLVVTATPHPQFTDNYYILQVATTGDDPAIPQCFYMAISLEEIEPKEAVLNHMRAITG